MISVRMTLALLALCATASAQQSPQASDYLVLQEGQKWTYADQAGKKSQMRVTHRFEVPGSSAPAFIVVGFPGTGGATKLELRAIGSSLYARKPNSGPFVEFVRFDAPTGAKVPAQLPLKGWNGVEATITTRNAFVSAGGMPYTNAAKVTFARPGSSAPFLEMFFVPHVGLVRTVQVAGRTTRTMMLEHKTGMMPQWYGQPNRAPSLGQRVAGAAAGQASGAGAFLGGYFFNAGLNAGWQNDPAPLIEAAQAVQTPEFWTGAAVFMGASSATSAAMRHPSVLARTPGALRGTAQTAIPLAIGIGTQQALSGEASAESLLRQTGAFAGAGLAVNAALLSADRHILPAAMAHGIPGRIALTAYTAAKLGLMLHAGEKADYGLQRLLGKDR